MTSSPFPRKRQPQAEGELLSFRARGILYDQSANRPVKKSQWDRLK